MNTLVAHPWRFLTATFGTAAALLALGRALNP